MSFLSPPQIGSNEWKSRFDFVAQTDALGERSNPG
jgi:hypothetical protein